MIAAAVLALCIDAMSINESTRRATASEVRAGRNEHHFVLHAYYDAMVGMPFLSIAALAAAAQLKRRAMPM
jgi:hypothetical protein